MRVRVDQAGHEQFAPSFVDFAEILHRRLLADVCDLVAAHADVLAVLDGKIISQNRNILKKHPINSFLFP